MRRREPGPPPRAGTSPRHEKGPEPIRFRAFPLRRRGDLNPRSSFAGPFISSEVHSAALARLHGRLAVMVTMHMLAASAARVQRGGVSCPASGVRRARPSPTDSPEELQRPGVHGRGLAVVPGPGMAALEVLVEPDVRHPDLQHPGGHLACLRGSDSVVRGRRPHQQQLAQSRRRRRPLRPGPPWRPPPARPAAGGRASTSAGRPTGPVVRVPVLGDPSLRPADRWLPTHVEQGDPALTAPNNSGYRVA